MPPAQKRSTLKKECKALQSPNGSVGERICINGKYYVPWKLPTHNDDDSSTGLCKPCDIYNDNEDETFPVSNIEYDTTHIDVISDGNVIDNDIFPESDVESMTSETTTDSNTEYKRPTYAAMTESSNKIISFPELKKKVEGDFLCKECIFTHGIDGISMSTLSVRQETLPLFSKYHVVIIILWILFQNVLIIQPQDTVPRILLSITSF